MAASGRLEAGVVAAQGFWDRWSVSPQQEGLRRAGSKLGRTGTVLSRFKARPHPRDPRCPAFSEPARGPRKQDTATILDGPSRGTEPYGGARGRGPGSGPEELLAGKAWGW